MRDIHGPGAPQPTPASSADEESGRLPRSRAGGPTPGGDADPSARYAADHAALAFGIPRIAPVLLTASEPPFAAGGETSAVPEERDLTESLTADEQEVVAAFAAFAPEVVAAELNDPVTAALRIPKSRPVEPRPTWSGTQRLPFVESPTVHTTTLARPRLPAESVGLFPGEGATTTVTLPPGPSAMPRGGCESLAKAVLIGSVAVLALGLAVLLGRALAKDPGPPPPTALSDPRPDGLGRERLIEQALTAIREGRREHAVALLFRYQSFEPAQKPDRAVELMLRVLRRELLTPGPGR